MHNGSQDNLSTSRSAKSGNGFPIFCCLCFAQTVCCCTADLKMDTVAQIVAQCKFQHKPDNSFHALKGVNGKHFLHCFLQIGGEFQDLRHITGALVSCFEFQGTKFLSWCRTRFVPVSKVQWTCAQEFAHKADLLPLTQCAYIPIPE